MKAIPKVGTQFQKQLAVEQKHLIDFAGEGMPAVLSTPVLIGLLERTAREGLSESLEPDERSVGAEIELRHMAPAGLGQQITCTARIISVDGREITFQVEARDEHEVLARGLHKRAVIRIQNFARRLENKLKPRQDR